LGPGVWPTIEETLQWQEFHADLRPNDAGGQIAGDITLHDLDAVLCWGPVFETSTRAVPET
jgi:hypothetical protein